MAKRAPKKSTRVTRKAPPSRGGRAANPSVTAAKAPARGPAKITAKTRAPAKSKTTAKPKLLAGGNPQIPKGDGDAPVQAYIAAMPGWKREVGRRLDEIIVRTLPDVRKAVRWNSPFYGVEGRGWFLSAHCITRYVKVAFLNGTSLRPVPPVESRNEGTRYLHIHEGDEIDEALVTSWVRQASRLDGERCF